MQLVALIKRLYSPLEAALLTYEHGLARKLARTRTDPFHFDRATLGTWYRQRLQERDFAHAGGLPDSIVLIPQKWLQSGQIGESFYRSTAELGIAAVPRHGEDVNLNLQLSNSGASHRTDRGAHSDRKNAGLVPESLESSLRHIFARPMVRRSRRETFENRLIVNSLDRCNADRVARVLRCNLYHHVRIRNSCNGRSPDLLLPILKGKSQHNLLIRKISYGGAPNPPVPVLKRNAGEFVLIVDQQNGRRLQRMQSLLGGAGEFKGLIFALCDAYKNSQHALVRQLPYRKLPDAVVHPGNATA